MAASSSRLQSAEAAPVILREGRVAVAEHGLGRHELHVTVAERVAVASSWQVTDLIGIGVNYQKGEHGRSIGSRDKHLYSHTSYKIHEIIKNYRFLYMKILLLMG